MSNTLKLNGAGNRRTKTQTIIQQPREAAPERILNPRESELESVASTHEYVEEKLSSRLKSKRHTGRDRSCDNEIILHACTCQLKSRTGGACGYMVHSDEGFDQGASWYRHLTERELEVHGLIKAFDALENINGRITVYTTSHMLVYQLTHGISLWRHQPEHLHMPKDPPSWDLLFRLFDERQATISHIEPSSNLAIRYCERLAKMCHESGGPIAADRRDVLRSLANT